MHGAHYCRCVGTGQRGRAENLSPALGPVWRAAHERLSSGKPVSRIRVGPLTEEQRAALADLLGLDRLPPESVTVTVARLDEVLTEAVGLPLKDVVAELVGPIGNRAQEREAQAKERAELWDWLTRSDVVVGQPALNDWVEAVRKGGLVDGSAERTKRVLSQTLDVLAELPAAGVPLPVLAQRTLHDPHGLDEGTRQGSLTLKALAAIYDVPVPADVQQKRGLWERAGVADDELSSVVLVAGMRPEGEGVASKVLRACEGHAAALTLGQLRATRWAGGLPETVWVVENPSVLALALKRFNDNCPPMVCTSGWPNSAGILLLSGLAEAGCGLRYHGDFDGEGIRIAANVMARTGAVPWRMGAADYLDAVGTVGPSVGRVTEAPWDERLAGVMREHGVTVSEERVADVLLAELHSNE